ncbi:hypothetical protein D3C80_1766030 [compost metagenome]
MQQRADTPQVHAQLWTVQLQAAIGRQMHHTGKRRLDRSTPRHLQINVQRTGVRLDRTVRPGTGQTVLPVTAGGQAMGGGRFDQQALIDAVLLPVARFEMRAQHSQVDQRELAPHQARQQRRKALAGNRR